ncbi:DUF3466 family protein [Pseudoalteromonas sp. G4]|uniref:DUF3466 family protein n=1 Tax=Pseudoalteromonas sp. G4 TaxID=2992761 RepID=UPI00237E3ADD|nr:DUF3466 family protein [Pseudoalteromonas sp. G4]MDE3273255.1 DUF3466 family protein [Pseudoalteromonas sp. G4]
MKYKLLAAAVFAAITPQVQGATPYVLEELGNLSYAKHAFVTDMNEAGQAVGMAQGVFDIHIDIDELDFEDSRLKSFYDSRERYFESIDQEITFTLEDIQNGTINGDAQRFLQDYLLNYYTDTTLQKISKNNNVEFYIGIEYNNTTIEQVVYDVTDPDYNGLTRSVETNLTAISEDGVKVGWGSAPYKKVDFLPDGETESETHYIRDFTRRGFVITPSGERVDLMPIEQTYGGVSIATDILKMTDGYVVIGESSVSIASDALERLEDRCDGEQLPLEACYEGYVTSTSYPLYNRHATKWILDPNFNVIDIIDLGIGIIPDEDEQKKAWVSSALALNSNDITVGYSVVRYRDGDNITIYPVYYKDGSVIEFIDEDNYRPGGRAVAINNANIITGYAIERIEGTDRSKFFYHDITSGETTFPKDFFKSSSAVANDINDNGLIVGQGEVETTSSARRRQEGFIYDINSETFTNLNDLLPCYASDGETVYPYVVSEAIGINNDGTVYGTATKTVDKRDAQGNVVVDSTGKVEQESIVVPVKLTYNPNGVADTCPPKEKETYERQGASFGLVGLLLLPLVAIRRRLFK